jgi:hypothetical protein
MADFKTYRTASGASIAALLAKVGDRAKEALGKQLYLEAEGIMAQSKELVPVDTGALRSTGIVSPPVIEGDLVSVELGYGGPAAPYAVIVHENLEAHHPHGMAKYLEVPFDAAKRGMLDRVAAGIREEVEAGGAGR